MEEKIKFRTKILGAMKELTKENVQEIKFLLKGQVGEGILENIQTSLHLYQELEKLRWITADSLDFLFQLLHGVNRGDIVNMLHEGKPQINSPLIPNLARNVMPDQPIDRKVLDEIANNIASDWKRLGRYLNIPEAKIDQIDEDYRKVYEKSLQTLQMWTKTVQSLGRSTSWKILKEALAGLPRFDIIRMIECNFPDINRVVNPSLPAATPDLHPGYIQASSITDEKAACTVLDSTSRSLDHLHIDPHRIQARSTSSLDESSSSINSVDTSDSEADILETVHRVRQNGTGMHGEHTSTTCIAESFTSPQSSETVLNNKTL